MRVIKHKASDCCNSRETQVIGSLYQALKDTQYGGNEMTSLVLY